jgi:hypothetical protein
MTPSLGMRYAAVDTTEVTMKLSARNVLKGRILGIDKGAVTSHVRLAIGGLTVTD